MSAVSACSPMSGVLAGMTDKGAVEEAVVSLFQPPGRMPESMRAILTPDGDQWQLPGIGKLAISPSPGAAAVGKAAGMRRPMSSESLGDAPEAELSERLALAEGEFLTSERVATRNVTEAELASRFQKTTMAEAPSDVGEYMDSLVQGVVRDSIHCSAPKMIGHMTSSLPYFLRPLSKLVTTLNQNTVKTETAKTVTFLERESLAMVHRVLYRRESSFYRQFVQDPDSILGLFTSGGTLANVSALWVARNAALPPREEPPFRGVEKEGVVKALHAYGYADAVVIGSRLLHYSLAKATDVLGLGVGSMKLVPYDDDYRVKLDLMEKAIQECREKNILVVCLVGVGGATETGTIDPLNGIADLAEKYKIHFHVDAAWGGPCMFSAEHRDKLAGIERASSVTLDGHKQLYMPMGCGLCLLKHPNMVDVVKKTANYIIRKESYDLGKFTLEGSRPANALFLHANLNILGVKGYAALVDRSIRLARYMADRVHQMPNFEVVSEPMTNILLYRHVPAELYQASLERPLTEDENKRVDKCNVQLQTAQKEAGRTFVSRTTVHSPRQQRPVVALRVVIANPLTNQQDIDAVLQDQIGILEHGGSEAAEEEAFQHTPSAGGVVDLGSSPMGTPPMHFNPTAGGGYWDAYWHKMPQQVKNIFQTQENFMEKLQASNSFPAASPAADGAELDT
eukprot:TRINITY_DN2533_c4_g1_i1.p1 TRINITY_DN2533_c4_g1~~TRINITY_DN2533_c4_g1_i1.p1  ORF type:complete len:682 (+),score=272.90 TRINITY_DN2533_c4_g1_i1:116-2161(+)